MAAESPLVGEIACPDDPAPAALKSEMETHGWAQYQLGISLDWSQPTVSRVLAGTTCLGWRERLRVVTVLGISPQELGVYTGQSGRKIENVDGYASPEAYQGELLRARGESQRAAKQLANVRPTIETECKEMPSDENRQRLAEVLLAEAAAIGDIKPDVELRETSVKLTREALLEASHIHEHRRPTALWWRAKQRHGNEQRKAEDYDHAEEYLRTALDVAPDHASRALTLVSLARWHYQTRDQQGFDKSMAELRRLLDDTSLWSSDFHPVAVLDSELRGAIVFDSPTHQRSDELRRLVEFGGLIPDPARMAPYWHSIWGVSVAADALRTGDVEVARRVADQALQPARREGYDRQVLRLRRLLDSIGEAAPGDDLQRAAVNIIAAVR